MTDPTGYIYTKIAAMIGGFIGGSVILSFIRPKTIGEAFIRGGVSVGTAGIFTSPVLNLLNVKENWEWQLMIGFSIGFVAYSVLGMIANFLIKRQDDDLIDVAEDLKALLAEKSSKEKQNKESPSVTININKEITNSETNNSKTE